MPALILAPVDGQWSGGAVGSEALYGPVPVVLDDAYAVCAG